MKQKSAKEKLRYGLLVAIAIATSVWLLGGCGGGGGPGPGPTVITISGTVCDATTEEPVQLQTDFITLTPTKVRQTSASEIHPKVGQAGNFAFENVTPGQYRLTIDLGTQGKYQKIVIDIVATSNITLNIYLVPNGLSVAGVLILDENGNEIKDSFSLQAGQEYTFKAKVVDKDGNDITNQFKNLTWVTTGNIGSISESKLDYCKFKAADTAGDGTLGVYLAEGASYKIKITVTKPQGQPSSIVLTADPQEIDPGQTSTITAKVVDKNGNPVSGAAVDFTVSDSGASISPSSATTDQNGIAKTTLKAGDISGITITVNATIGGTTISKSVDIKVRPQPSSIVLTADPQEIDPGQTSTITATVVDKTQHPLQGLTVDFTASDSSATLSPSSATTDQNGIAKTTLTAGDISGITITVNATVRDFNISNSVDVKVRGYGGVNIIIRNKKR
jgi:protocatechuate 3,4-dioxygenase beta subunit